MTPPPPAVSARHISADQSVLQPQFHYLSLLLENFAHAPWSFFHRHRPLEIIVRSRLDRAASLQATVNGWMNALAIRDGDTCRHTRRVTALAVQLARAMGLTEDQVQTIRWGAMLHDIGKMSIPDRILLKPGPLEPEDWHIMQQHPVLAIEMLRSVPYLDGVLDIPYCHHEHWDGNGYPRGLKGQEIPLSARIFSVVDVWDALGSQRPYRAAWTRQRSLDYLSAQAGRQFDPDVVQYFFTMSAAEHSSD